MKINCILLALFLVIACRNPESQSKIDRFALVSRHNVTLNSADTLNPLSVGNGEFAFTMDVTGLQTFYQDYENGIPLGTQSQWGWHSIPSREKVSLNDVLVAYESCDGSKAQYPVQHLEGKAGQATEWLRANPHRLHLGIIGLKLLKSNGNRATLADIKNVNQTLDLWTGKIESNFEFEGEHVLVETYGHQDKDQVSFIIQSKLIDKKRLAVELKFPYGKDCHVCPGYDFTQPERHQSTLIVNGNSATISRQVDSTQYFANLIFSDGNVEEKSKHEFELTPSETSLTFSVLFTRNKDEHVEDFENTATNSTKKWKEFWSSGGAIDFSQCTDERAAELERRIILSQYLTKIQCSGSLPPQETGLTFNSWYGKFHMEMYWWHGAHFALWNRDSLLEKSMAWYTDVIEKARATATLQGYKGARWQKMTDYAGAESPSNVGAFIIWQQPHPVYLAELLYRNNPTKETLQKYRDIVFNTAEFMASFLKKRDDVFHLCHPLIPAQEIFKPESTDDPTYELQYWEYGLRVAQQWRSRVGEDKNEEWENILNRLAPLPASGDLYLPVATAPKAYTDDTFRRDHPSVLAAYGFLPLSERVDSVKMDRTLTEIMNKWNWASTWGWDYPIIAMTATRLHKPEIALQALMMDTQKNTYLKNGHNYQDKRLRIYLPGNGGLLAAVALMTAGWDGNKVSNPGFPKEGKWNVRWEGIQRMP